VVDEIEEDLERFATTPIDNSAELPETPALPPWRIRADTHDTDIAAMCAWVNAKLDDLDTAFDMEHAELWDTQDWGPGTTQEEARRLWNLEIAKAKARDGDFTWLRRMMPALAEFLNPPRRKRGERRRHPDWSFEEERTRLAIDDVYRIRRIWAQPAPHGYGKWKRPLNDDVTAEAIAAARHNLVVDPDDPGKAVREALKREVSGLRYSARNLPSLR
jgi:hypothetical protein